MMRLWSLIERGLAALSGLALASLIALPATQVVLRDFFSAPVIGLEEATRYGLIALVFLAVPLLIRTNEQIRLAEFINHLPRRARLWLERATLLSAATALGIIAWAGVGSALKNASTRTPTLDIPFWLFIAPMIAGLGLAAVGCLLFALRRDDPPTGDGTTQI